MNIITLIEKKKNGLELTKNELDYIIKEYVEDNIKEYQMSSFLMAVCLKGMNFDEIFHLTKAIIDSGDIVDLSMIDGIKVDKHSTGGVGDKISLTLVPLLGSLGIKVAKLSGKGLGITGGTIDKLESIPGLNTKISKNLFVNQINDINIGLIGQTQKICPADKKIYALRDVTGTVDSIPLIASSIMSKKIASGADVICMDVKLGSGSFMKTLEEAEELADIMIKIGEKFNKKVIIFITNMEEPLGYKVGNILEIQEAIDVLNGNGPVDVWKLTKEMAIQIMKKCTEFDEQDIINKIDNSIKNKDAINKFIELVKWQGGDTKFINDYNLFDKSSKTIEVLSEENGFVYSIKCNNIGMASNILGAGREELTEVINFKVGIELHAKVGDKVSVGDKLCTIHSDNKNESLALELVKSAYDITNEKRSLDLIYKIKK